jgi:type IV pilus assembly protein PilN
MLRINLLPVKKIKQRAAAWQQLKIFGAVFVALLAILILAFLHLNGKVSGLKTDIANLEQKKTALAEILKQIEELKQKKKAIDDQTTLIENVEKSSALTAHIMDEVANVTPNERLWLTSFNQSGTALNLSGVALDNQTVAEYLDKLDGSQYISDVKLVNASLTAAQGGRSLKSFTLSCTAAMPAAEAEKEKEATPEGPGAATAQKN